MSKNWTFLGRKVNPIVFAGICAGAFYLFKKQMDKRMEQAIYKQFFGQSTMPASSAITVPAGKVWLVNLRNGDTTQMTSAQLQNALDAKAVKSYSEITTKKA